MATRGNDRDRENSDGMLEHVWELFQKTDGKLTYICKRCGIDFDTYTALLRAGSRTYSAASRKYRLEFPGERSKSTVVLIKKYSGRMINGRPAGEWILRSDRPHGRPDYAHMNINPRVTGKPDPHTRIPEWGPGAARKTAKIVQRVGKAVRVAGLVVDVIYVGWKMFRDIKNGTTRNTVEAASSVSAGYASAEIGSAYGASVGAVIGGPVGAVIGGVAGAMVFSVAGSMVAEHAVGKIADAKGYNIKEEKCESCRKIFKARKYLAEKKCPGCQKKHA